MNCTMEDYLKVVTPHLRPELVSPEALSRICALAQILPPFSLALLECRLGADQSRVDFEVYFSRIAPSLPEIFLNHPTWRSFQEICQELIELESFLHQKVKHIWLEFDVDGQLAQVPVPCIFFSLNQETVSEPQELIEMASRLLNHPVSSLFESNLRLSMNCLPAKARIIYIGAMLSRSNQAVRIVISGIPPEQLLDYLVQIGWINPTDTLRSLVSNLSGFVDHIQLACDVGETVLPRIGLECFLLEQPKHEPRWQLFLDYLVETGLCTPAKQNALFAWPGFFQKASQPELWPNNLTWGDLFLGGRAFSIFTRKINHIKIVYQPGTFLEAKAYLGFAHKWFDASPLTREDLQKNEDCNQINLPPYKKTETPIS